MKYRSEKGYTGVEIAISVIIITIFISLIAALISRFNTLENKVKYKEEALAIAIEEIENVKLTEFEKYANLNMDSKTYEDGTSLIDQPTSKEGYYKTIVVKDYTDAEENIEKISGLVKKVTVKIAYMFKGEEQNIELSTIISKEN